METASLQHYTVSDQGQGQGEKELLHFPQYKLSSVSQLWHM